MHREACHRSPRAARLSLAAALAFAACSPIADVGGYPPDSGEDTASDADTDADTDVDSDADSDTDTEIDWPSTTTPETCEEASDLLTSMGCAFFAADLDQYGGNQPGECTDDTEGWNMDLGTFAVIVANPQEGTDADFTVSTKTDGDIVEIFSETLGPGETSVVRLTGSCAGCLLPDRAVQTQGLGAGLGFLVESSVPVMAFQWNPYDDANLGEASLLLPVAVLGDRYIGQGWRTGSDCGEGGFDNASQLTIVAAEDDTLVTVQPEKDDIPEVNGVGPVAQGEESAPFHIDAHDVLSFAAATGGPMTIPDDTAYHGDLTGTIIRADKPIAVFGGHVYGMVPSTSSLGPGDGDLNHLEEQLLPYRAWGTDAVLARHAVRPMLEDDEDPVLWRVVAGADGMTVTFHPPLPSPWGGEHHFDARGEVLEFVSDVSHLAEGTLDETPLLEDGGVGDDRAPFLAYQLMSAAVGADGQGDGMMLIAAPTDQYLDKYVFVTSTDADYDYDYLTIVKEPGTLVHLDCTGIIDESEFHPVGGSGWEVAWVYIDDPLVETLCVDGPHVVRAKDGRIGVSVVGTAVAGAYGFLAGIGAKAVNPVVIE
jgi:hypothetical protein